MKKITLLFIVFVAAGLMTLQAQTTHTVAPGDDLIQIVANAADGDIIEVEAGVHKANSDYIRIIDKSVTIKAADDAEEMPRPRTRQ